jgi:RNA polymerase sigma-70 factor, ECF subfamily
VNDAITEDSALIERAKGGDRGAFGEIVVRHQAAVYGYLRSRVFDPADAEDLAQESFLRFYIDLARFDGTAIRPWLIGIARNVLRENLRRCRRRREVAWTRLCLEFDGLEVPAAEDDGNGFDEALGHLGGCLDSLGTSARQAVDLHYAQKLRLAEIGRRLRRSEGAVKLLMFRARQALRLCIDAKTHG